MKKKTLCAALAAACVAGVANAQVDITQPGTTLAAVIGNTFQVGDKVFSIAPTGFSSTTFAASDIFISPLINADPATGEGFRLTGAWVDAPGDAISSTFLLTYDVAVMPQFAAVGNRISSAAMRFNGFATGAGSQSRLDASMTVESVGAGTLAVFNTGSNPDFQDERVLPNYAALRMAVTGSFTAAGETGTSGMSFMDLSFGRTVIPGPSALAVMGLGLLATRRRR